MLRLIPLIPLLPLAGAAVCGLGIRRLRPRAVHGVACGAMLAAFILAVAAVADLAGGVEEYRALAQGEPSRYEVSAPGEPARFETTPALWMPLGPIERQGAPAVPGLERDSALTIGWTFQIDALTAVMLLVVTGIGFLIHVYSIGYMAGDPGYGRFFAYLNLFAAMMLVLVLGGNFLVMFVGWEGVGLCSYLLIGYYYDRVFDRETGMTCADAGRKAFIANRVGDFAFVLGMLFLVVLFGTLDFSEVMARIDGHSAGWFGSGLLALVGVLLFIGATGKSAQIPLYVWLPDAMAGPTPVSALIHAATMVTAGVYMLARTSSLYWHSPQAMSVVAVVGCATAVFAATMGIAQNDVKKVLAYSTVSQLGYMFLGAGVGAFVPAIFHLVTHAFFKACLFLGAGSVITANHHETDMRRYGGLVRWMPWTFRTYLVATLAIAGFPLLSGFFSKDEILASALLSSRGHAALWVVGTLAAVITSFYMFRTVWMTFLGESRAPEAVRAHLHESPPVMTGVLGVLAAGAVLAGFLGVPAGLSGLVGAGDVNVFERWLHPVVAARGVVAAGGHGHGPASTGDGQGASRGGAAAATAAPWTGLEEGRAHLGAGAEWGLVLVAVGVFAAGLVLAWTVYGRRPGLAGRIAAGAGPLYRLVYRKYLVDELYERTLLAPFRFLSRFFAGVDRWVVDGLVNAAGVTAEVTGQVAKLLQTGLVRNYALIFLLGVVVALFVAL